MSALWVSFQLFLLTITLMVVLSAASPAAVAGTLTLPITDSSGHPRGDLNCDHGVTAYDALAFVRQEADLFDDYDCPATRALVSDVCLLADDPSEGTEAVNPPSDLEASYQLYGTGSVAGTLSWVDQSANDTCLVVERAVEPGDFAIVAIVQEANECLDYDARRGQTVHYRVYAASTAGRSPYTDTETITHLPPGTGAASATPAPELGEGLICGGESVRVALRRADFDCNGFVTPGDLVALLRSLAELPASSPDVCLAPSAEIAAVY